ncbi:MAG: glycosyltransferase family 39 protein [Candidatus Buchananbacteria bacterium]|nr:glycosyltransferase family 39 protein [Candidatus Buchananbacteria bacterium]
MLKSLLKIKYLLPAIVFVIAAILIFGGLTRADVQHDDATYSFRSLGYLDFMNSQLQTTPLQWFETVPTWSKLSFHDHPPLTFALQHVSFKLFGPSLFASRLPSALAGVFSVVLLFLIAKKQYDFKTAALASALLGVLAIHSWMSQISYLEPVAVFLILLTVYLFILALEKEIWWLGFGASLGLTLLTKYTVLFIIPALAIYLLLYHRKIFFNKYFIVSMVLAVLIFSPVVYYNIKMYQARGHFDLQLSVLLNQDRSDWPGISRNSAGVNFLNNLTTIFKDLFAVISLPMYLMLCFLTIYGAIMSFIERQKNKTNFIFLLLLLFVTILIAVTGAVVRFDYLLLPFVVVIASWASFDIYQRYIASRPDRKGRTIIILLALGAVIVFELFYNINTNLLAIPLGERGRAYSEYRWENGGFNELEEYLISQGLHFEITNHVDSLSDTMFQADQLSGQKVFVYDPNLNWFSTMWYFSKWSVYNREFFISAADLMRILPNTNWFDFFKEQGAETIYYIRGANKVVFGPGEVEAVNQQSASALENIFISSGAKADLVRNANDDLAFKVYKINLQE